MEIKYSVRHLSFISYIKISLIMIILVISYLFYKNLNVGWRIILKKEEIKGWFVLSLRKERSLSCPNENNREHQNNSKEKNYGRLESYLRMPKKPLYLLQSLRKRTLKHKIENVLHNSRITKLRLLGRSNRPLFFHRWKRIIIAHNRWENKEINQRTRWLWIISSTLQHEKNMFS